MGAVYALWRREMIKFVRDANRVLGALLQPLLVWLLMGFGFRSTFQLPDAGIPYLEFLFPGIVALVALFTSIFSTISIVEERRSGFLQGALVAPVSRSALVLGTILGGTTLALGEAVLFFLLLPLLGVVPSAIGLLLMLLVTTLIGVSFTALGVVMAWRTETTRGFHALMNLFLMPLWLLSGGFFPAEGAPRILQWVIRLNPVSYGIDALRQGLYLPDSPPVGTSSLGISLTVTILLAVFLTAIAVRVVSRPID